MISPFLGLSLFFNEFPLIIPGYKRGLRNQHENTALLKVGGASTKEDSWFYVGKKCVAIYSAKNKTCVPGKPKSVKSHKRAIWGKITRPHGTSGALRAKFVRNLPGNFIGKRIRIVSCFRSFSGTCLETCSGALDLKCIFD